MPPSVGFEERLAAVEAEAEAVFRSMVAAQPASSLDDVLDVASSGSGSGFTHSDDGEGSNDGSAYIDPDTLFGPPPMSDEDGFSHDMDDNFRDID